MSDNGDMEVHRPAGNDAPDDTNIVTQMQAMLAGWGPAHDPIADRLTSEHVGKAIDNHAKSMDLTAADRKDQRGLTKYIVTFVGVVILVICGALILTGHAPMVERILTIVGSFFVGAVGGYGYGLKQGIQG